MNIIFLILIAFGIFLSLLVFIVFIYWIHMVWEGAYIGGGSLDSDPDLSPSYEYDSFGYLSFNSIFVVGPIMLGIISLAFLVPNIILRLKNIPTRKYMLVIGAAILLLFGFSSVQNGMGSLLSVDNVSDESSQIRLIGGLISIIYAMIFIIPAIILLRKAK